MNNVLINLIIIIVSLATISAANSASEPPSNHQVEAFGNGAITNVQSHGVGTNADSARKDALVAAVRQAVGVFIDQETLIKNETVIEEKILSVSSGMVVRYDEIRPPRLRPDGLWDVYIQAVVKKTEVGASLRSIGVMRIQDDGSQAWARQVTTLQNREDAMALVKKLFPDLLPNLIQGRIVENRNIEDGDSGKIAKVVNIEYKINKEWWDKEAYPALDAAFTALKLGEEPSVEEVINLDASPRPRFRDSQFRLLPLPDNQNRNDTRFPIDLYRSKNKFGSTWLRKRFYLPKVAHEKVSAFLLGGYAGSIANEANSEYPIIYKQFISAGSAGFKKLPVFSSIHLVGVGDQEIHQILVVPDVGVLGQWHWTEYGGCLFKFFDPMQNANASYNPSDAAGFVVNPKLMYNSNLRLLGPFFIAFEKYTSERNFYLTDNLTVQIKFKIPEEVMAALRVVELRSASFGIQKR